MSPPKDGALGWTFTAMRGMQFISLVAIIGMTANFVAEIVGANQQPYSVLVGTLVISSIATLYVALTWILYYDSAHQALQKRQLLTLISAACDSALLIAVIVVATTIGKPLSYLSCPSLANDGSAAAFLGSVGSNVSLKPLDYFVWVGADQTICYEIKAVWGLSIALCVLFAFSAIVLICLWYRHKGASPPNKDCESQ